MNKREAYRILQNASPFKVGDTVKVLRQAKNRECGWDCIWSSQMDKAIGKTLEITHINQRLGIMLQLPDGDCYWFPFFVLQLIEPETKPDSSIEEAYFRLQNDSGIEIGDTVRVMRKADRGEYGWNAFWAERMNKFIGNKFDVKDIGKYGFALQYCAERYWFPFFVLELVEKGSNESATTDQLNS